MDEREDEKYYRLFYYDRINKKNIKIKFRDIKEFDKLFIKINRNKKEISIPLHRIKIVKRNEDVIWKR